MGIVLVNLAADSGQWSRQLLQNLVDILTAMVDGIVETLKGDALDIFREKYADVVSISHIYNSCTVVFFF